MSTALKAELLYFKLLVQVFKLGPLNDMKFITSVRREPQVGQFQRSSAGSKHPSNSPQGENLLECENLSPPLPKSLIQ